MLHRSRQNARPLKEFGKSAPKSNGAAIRPTLDALKGQVQEIDDDDITARLCRHLSHPSHLRRDMARPHRPQLLPRPVESADAYPRPIWRRRTYSTCSSPPRWLCLPFCRRCRRALSPRRFSTAPFWDWRPMALMTSPISPRLQLTARHEPGRHGVRHGSDGADCRRRISRRQIFWLKREPGDENPCPDNGHQASRLGTKFRLVKIVILYLTNVQNIHVTLVGARPQLE